MVSLLLPTISLACAFKKIPQNNLTYTQYVCINKAKRKTDDGPSSAQRIAAARGRALSGSYRRLK